MEERCGFSEGKLEGLNGRLQARGGGQAFGLPFYPGDFPVGNPERNSYPPNIS